MGKNILKISSVLIMLLLSNSIYAQVWTNWKIAGESPNADSAQNISLSTLRTLIIAGTGTGSVTGVTGTANRITASASTTNPTIDIASTYVGQASITTLGTITSGTWNGTTVGVANGGTGATTFTSGAILKGAGTSAITTATAGTDYSAGTSALGTGIVKSTTGTGALTIAIAADFPTLNQSTTGNAATVTTNANLTGVVTSVGNATSIGAAAITNTMLANNSTSANGVTLTLGGTNATAFTLQNVTTAGATTSTASTFSGGLTSSGATAVSGVLTISNQLVATPGTTATATGTLGVGAYQMPINATSAIVLTISSGATVGTIMECPLLPTSTAQITFTASGSETFNGGLAAGTFTVSAGSQNTTVKFLKYSSTGWRASLIQ